MNKGWLAARVKQLFKRRSTSGQTLIEVVVAVALGVVVIVALVGLGARTNRSVNYAKVAEIASKYAQEGQEIIRQIRDQNGEVNGPGSVLVWDNLYTSGSTYTNQAFDFVQPGVAFCNAPANVWCLDSAAPVDGQPYAPGTGGVRIERRAFISDDINVDGVGDCFLDPFYVGVGAGGLLLNATQVKSVRVQVLWNDPTGQHEINLQSCITRTT